MSAVMKKKGLGRGLDALLGGSVDITEAARGEGTPTVLPLDKLQAGSISRARAWTKARCRNLPPAFARRV